MRLFAALAMLLAQAAEAQDIEPARRLLEERAVHLTLPADNECNSQFGDRCRALASAAILMVAEGIALLATAEHVLPATNTDELASITLTWNRPPAECRSGMKPIALWRPAVPGSVADDIAFIAATVSCSAPLEPVPNAWANGTPSFGVAVRFFAGSPPEHSAAISLSDSCIRAQSCFEGGVVHIQNRIDAGVSGSAVFSASGLVGIASNTTHLVATPRMLEWLAACAADRCRQSGEDIDLQPWLDAVHTATPIQ